MKALSRLTGPLTLLSLAIGLAAFGLLAAGESPYHVLKAILAGAFGSRDDLARTLLGATPLILTGLAVAIPFRAGLFNIGAEGQMVLAGFAAGAAAALLAGVSPLLAIPVVVLAAAVIGGLWGGLAGLFRAKLGVHEVIVTILLNFLCFSLVAYLLRVRSLGLMADGMEPKTAELEEGLRLGGVVPGVPIGIGFLFAIGLALVFEFLLFRSRPGLMLRAQGGNPRAAEATGVPVRRVIVLAMFLGGGLAGLAGLQQVLEVHGSYVEGFSPGYGFTGIAVALLGLNRPIGVVLAALFFAVLKSGAFVLDALAGIPRESIGLFEVLVIVLVAADRIRESARGRLASQEGAA